MRGTGLFAWASLFSLSAALGWSQTTIDLRRQARNVDFSAALFTKPNKTGTALPATCSAGETFFKTDAPAGQNLYLCTAPNVWTVGSSSSSSFGAGLGIAITGGTIAVDDSVVPLYYTGAGAPTLACATGRDYYIDTISGQLFFCRAANTWLAVGSGGGGGGAGSTVFAGAMGTTLSGAGAHRFFGLSGGGGNGSELLVQTPVAAAGTLRDLYVRLSGTQPGGSMVCTIKVNSVATSVAVTFPANDANATRADVAHTVNVVAGDLVALDCQNNASATSAILSGYSVRLVQ